MRLFKFLAITVFLFAQNLYAMDSEHTGSWYYSEQSGHGFSIEVGETGDGTPLALVYWYTYDSEGFPVFLIGTGYPDENGVEINFNAHYGMVYGVFNPDTVNRPEAGVGTFTFQDANNGTFSYVPSEWTITNYGHSATEMPISKLFGVSYPDEVIVEVPVYIEVPVYNAVVSQVSSDFDGFDDGNLFELTNGQIWQQTEFYYWYHYSYRPDIVIYEKYGLYYASVEGISNHVQVNRIQ